jgi:hypothetical protein
MTTDRHNSQSLICLEEKLPYQQPPLSKHQSNTDLFEYINPKAPNKKARMALEAHGHDDRNNHGQDYYKTVMCQNWLESASCGFGRNCKFAHGEHELRYTGPGPLEVNNRKYKTRVCNKYAAKGICPYGRRCLFIHPKTPEKMNTGSKIANHGTRAFYQHLTPPSFAQSDVWPMRKLSMSYCSPPFLSTIGCGNGDMAFYQSQTHFIPNTGNMMGCYYSPPNASSNIRNVSFYSPKISSNITNVRIYQPQLISSPEVDYNIWNSTLINDVGELFDDKLAADGQSVESNKLQSA